MIARFSALFLLISLPSWSASLQLEWLQEEALLPSLQQDLVVDLSGYAVGTGFAFTDHLYGSLSYKFSDLAPGSLGQRLAAEVESKSLGASLYWQGQTYTFSLSYQQLDFDIDVQEVTAAKRAAREVSWFYLENIEQNNISFTVSRDIEFAHSFLSLDAGVSFNDQSADSSIQRNRNIINLTDRDANSTLANFSASWVTFSALGSLDMMPSLSVAYSALISGEDDAFIQTNRNKTRSQSHHSQSISSADSVALATALSVFITDQLTLNASASRQFSDDNFNAFSLGLDYQF